MTAYSISGASEHTQPGDEDDVLTVVNRCGTRSDVIDGSLQEAGADRKGC